MRTILIVMFGLTMNLFARAAHTEGTDPLAACKAQWTAVLESLPAHPLAPQALECCVEAEMKAGAADRCAALLAIAEAEPESDLGICAIEHWYGACGQKLSEGEKKSAISPQATTRVGARLFALMGQGFADVDGYLSFLYGDMEGLKRSIVSGDRQSKLALSLLLQWSATTTEDGQYPFLHGLHLLSYLPSNAAKSSPPPADLYSALAANLDIYGMPVFSRYLELYARGNDAGAEYALPILRAVTSSSLADTVKQGKEYLDPLWIGRNDGKVLLANLKSGPNAASAFVSMQLLAIAIRDRDSETLELLLKALDALDSAKDEGAAPRLHLIAATRAYLHEFAAQAPGDSFGTLLREAADRYTKSMMVEVKRVAAAEIKSGMSRGLRGWLESTAAQLGEEARYLAEAECLRVLLAALPQDVDATAWSTRLGKIESGAWRNYAAEAALLRTQWTHEIDATKRNRGMLDEARALYLGEDTKEARTLIQRALLTAPDTAIRDEAQVLEMLCEFRMGDVEEAKVLIDDFSGRRADSTWYPFVRLLRAYLLTLWGDYPAAIETCKQLQDVPLGEAQRRKVRELMKALVAITESPPDTVLDAMAQARPNVILISLDTTRPDRLGCYGNVAARTPNIDRIAAMGTVFDRAYSTSSWTKPSHASVFTGRYPLAHGAQGYDDMIAPRAETLPETLKALGYRTLATVSAPPLNSLYGFGRGFDVYDDYTYELDRICNQFLRGNEGPVKIHSGATSGLIMHAAMLSYNRLVKPDRPLFYFINYFDAHHNYQPVAPFNEQSRTTYFGNHWGVIDGWVDGAKPVDTTKHPVDRERLLSLYDDEITAVDKRVYTWVYRAEMEKKLENTYFVVFGDHGEEFMEHDSLTHGHSLYEEVLHVPLIICGPGIPKGKHIGAPVSLVDIFPTLLALLGQDAPAGLDGQSLVPLLQGETAQPRTIFASLMLQAFEGYAVIDGNEKLIADTREKVYRLFDLGKDPAEREDLAALRPERLHQLTDLMVRHQDAQRQQGLALDAGTQVTPDSLPTLEALTEQFRAMGYLGN